MAHLFHMTLCILLASVTTFSPTVNAITPNVIRTVVEKGQNRSTLSEPGNVSVACQTALSELIFSKETFKKLQVFDAFGKVEAGFLAGNWHWLGHFDECMNITDFKYCASFLNVDTKALLPTNSSQSLELVWGVCVPQSCSEWDVQNALTELLNFVSLPIEINSNYSAVSCASQPPYPFDAGFIGTITLCGIISVLMILGTAYDFYLRYRQKTSYKLAVNPDSTSNGISNGQTNGPVNNVNLESMADDDRRTLLPTPPQLAIWEQFILSFAVNRNLVKLLSTNTAVGSVACLNGIRVLSMSWVILGHTFFFPLEMNVTDNLAFAIKWEKQFGFQAVGNAFFSVDSFFFLSGVLLAYLILTKMAKTNGKIPWGWFYFHRYWRLTPALLMTTLIWMYIKPHVGNGPLWKSFQNIDSCIDYWWTNILYINNFYPSSFIHGCIGWVWYLANDMQFFVISPLILIPLYLMPWLGITIILALLMASFATTATLVGIHNIGPNGVQIPGLPPPSADFESAIYEKPYCRIPPYLVGILLGYFLYRQGERRLNLNPLTSALGWTIASAIGMSCVYGLYGVNNGEHFTLGAAILYESLSRFAWAVALSWVVVACREGYGGWVNNILSWSAWLPLSRITYSAYLLHPIVIYIFIGNFGNSMYASLWLQPLYFVGFFAMAYAAAMVMALFIEFPFGSMEKMFMPTRQT